MLREEILKNLTEIFRDVLDDDELILTLESTQNDIYGWDSISNISILAMIQSQFNISFDIEEITSIKNINDIINFIEVKSK